MSAGSPLEGPGQARQAEREMRGPGSPDIPIGMGVLLVVAVGSAIILACLVWRLLFGPVPAAVPVTTSIVSVIVASPILLFVQHVIRRLAQSKHDLTRLTTELRSVTSRAELSSRRCELRAPSDRRGGHSRRGRRLRRTLRNGLEVAA